MHLRTGQRHVRSRTARSRSVAAGAPLKWLLLGLVLLSTAGSAMAWFHPNLSNDSTLIVGVSYYDRDGQSGVFNYYGGLRFTFPTTGPFVLENPAVHVNELVPPEYSGAPYLVTFDAPGVLGCMQAYGVVGAGFPSWTGGGNLVPYFVIPASRSQIGMPPIRTTPSEGTALFITPMIADSTESPTLAVNAGAIPDAESRRAYLRLEYADGTSGTPVVRQRTFDTMVYLRPGQPRYFVEFLIEWMPNPHNPDDPELTTWIEYAGESPPVTPVTFRFSIDGYTTDTLTLSGLAQSTGYSWDSLHAPAPGPNPGAAPSMLLPGFTFLSGFIPDDLLGSLPCPPVATLPQAMDVNADDVRDIADTVILESLE